ncbi:GHKL domain-containing protein [Paenibacillus sp. RC67]|uniref:sensor histidine kinase n=1 Tax=Paenibacillus sp. RC67 TaxID=3039392 RepID=UPI0024ACF3F4|nr:GHKL domain-containing protein [Paenibacillus sp. RC67]
MANHDEAIAKQISISIEHSQSGSQYLMDMIGSQLRTTALLIQERLNPDINKVTDEELISLRDEIGSVTGITLFEKKPDGDIIGTRSTEPRERALSTKPWGGTWFKAFNQLFDDKNVNVDKGIKLPNYWVGPFEISTSDPTHVGTWGYYYDGSTNYLIDPWVLDESIKKYDEITGPKIIFDKTLQGNEDFIQEITIFNPEKVGKEIARGVNANNEKWVKLVDRQIMYGSYTYQHENDFANVHAAMDKKQIIRDEATINGKHVVKSFVPILDVKIPYVVSIVTDYAVIQNQLNSEFKVLAMIIIAVSIIIIGLVYIIVYFIGKIRDDAVRSTQENYIEQINAMFTTIRGQRHDFLNHVSTINAFIKLEKYEELRSYSNEFIQDIDEMNDIIQIGNPAISALMQSKMASAMMYKIDLIYRFQGMEELSNGIRSVDITKIMGNLIDNAFDEVIELTEDSADERWVSVTGEVTHGVMSLLVSNPLSKPITADEVRAFLKPGVSTKPVGHSGLGLAIIENLIKQYKGSIGFTIEDSTIHFHVRLPIEKHRKEAS